MSNDEAKLTDGYHNLNSLGQVLFFVVQPIAAGALAVALVQHLGIRVAFLPGLWMRRIADIYPVTAKTDEKDAFIITGA